MEKPFAAYKGSEPYVFVCYAHADAETVYPEISWLNDQGFNVWYDEGISPGTVWRNELADSIAGARLALFFVSPDAADSVHCQREVNFALDHGVPVLAIHLQRTDLPSGLDLTLSTIQAILKYDLSDADYRLKLVLGVSECVARGVAAAGAARPRAAATPGRLLMVTAAAAVAALAAILWTGVGGSPARDSNDVVRAELRLPEEHVLIAGSAQPPFAISPDGRLVAYTAGDYGLLSTTGTSLYIRDLRTGEVRAIADTDEARIPAFSQDGRWVSFVSDGRLRKVAVDGGSLATILEATGDREYPDIAWASGDQVLFSGFGSRGLRSVSGNGGESTVLTALREGETGHRSPHELPSGDLLFNIVSDDGSGRIAHLDMETGEITPLQLPGTQYRPAYLEPGVLVWSTSEGVGIANARLMAAAFDPDTLETGPAVMVMDRVQSAGGLGFGYYAVSANGSLVYMDYQGPRLNARMVRVSRVGLTQQITDERVFHFPRISPDGKWVAVAVHQSNGVSHDLFLYETGRDTGTRFTSGVDALVPVWTPDGKRVTYAGRSGALGDFDIYWKAIDEEGDGTLLLAGDGPQLPHSWSPDGRQLLYEAESRATGRDLWVLPVDDGVAGEPFPWLTGEADETSGVFSADGSLVAYVSDAADGDQVYVRPYPGPGRMRRVSKQGGEQPQWARSGRELYYRSDRAMLAADIAEAGDGSLQIGDAQVLFSGLYTSYGMSGANYSIAPNGGDFILLEAMDARTTYSAISLVLNWASELSSTIGGGTD